MVKSKHCYAILIVAISVIMVTPAYSEVTYTYSGNSFDTFFTGGNAGNIYSDGTFTLINPYSSADHLTFQFSLSTPLASNMPLSYIDSASLISWSASDTLHGNITTSLSDPSPSFFLYAQTNSTGEISDWSFGLRFAPNPTDPIFTSFQILSSLSGSMSGLHESVLAIPSSTAVPPPGHNYYPDYLAGTNEVGSWTTTVTSVPEPETYAMMLAGLGLVGIAWRREHRPKLQQAEPYKRTPNLRSREAA